MSTKSIIVSLERGQVELMTKICKIPIYSNAVTKSSVIATCKLFNCTCFVSFSCEFLFPIFLFFLLENKSTKKKTAEASAEARATNNMYYTAANHS